MCVRAGLGVGGCARRRCFPPMALHGGMACIDLFIPQTHSLRSHLQSGADTNSFSSSVVDCSAPLPGSKQSILQRFKLPVPAGHGTRKTSSGNGIAFFVANGERPESLPNDMWYALSEGHAGSSAAIHDFIRSQTKASLKKVKKTSALKDRCLDRGHGAVAALVLVDGAKPSASERGALKRLMAKYRTVRWCEFLFVLVSFT